MPGTISLANAHTNANAESLSGLWYLWRRGYKIEYVYVPDDCLPVLNKTVVRNIIIP